MPIPLRADFDAAGLRSAARRTRDAAQARRLLALAAVYDGATRTEAGEPRRPRKPRSGWARTNKARVERLRAEGLMTGAGERVIARAVERERHKRHRSLADGEEEAPRRRRQASRHA